MTYSEKQIAVAINKEAADWAAFFEVTDAVQIEGRKQVMRANVAVGYFKPLLPYLRAQEDMFRGEVRQILNKFIDWSEIDMDDFDMAINAMWLSDLSTFEAACNIAAAYRIDLR